MTYALLGSSEPLVDVGERVSLLEEALSSQDAMQVSPALPQDVAESLVLPDIKTTREFIHTLFDRLFRLGYLSEQDRSLLATNMAVGTPAALLQSGLAKAVVSRFQQETNIEVDGWAGPETWNALQFFYTFEGARIELGRDLPMQTGPSLIQLRAAFLRLDALGLAHEEIGFSDLSSLQSLKIGISHSRNDVEIRERLTQALVLPLGRFKVILSQVGLPTVSDEQAIDYLLRFDWISKQLSTLDVYSLPSGFLSKFSGFILRVLTIEMWLLDSTPKLQLPSSGVTRDDDLDRLRKGAQVFLRNMWVSRDKMARGKDPFVSLLMEVSPTQQMRRYTFVSRNPIRFFPVILRSIQLLVDTSKESASVKEDLLKKIRKDSKFRKALNRELSKPSRSRVWDGIRRAIGWLRRTILKVKNAAIRFVRDVYRVLFSFGTEAINAARQALSVMAQGLNFMTQRSNVGPNGALFTYRDLDFDYRIVVDNQKQDKVEQDARYLALRTRAFSLSVKFVGALISACVSFAKQVALGWIGVGLALLRISQEARSFAAWLREARSLEREIAVVSSI